jgi:hypothetical protein
LVEKQREDAKRDVTLGISRLQGEFDLRRNERVAVDGSVDWRRRARFRITVADLSEDEARSVLEALEGIGIANESEAVG